MSENQAAQARAVAAPASSSGGTLKAIFTEWRSEIGVATALVLLVAYCGFLAPNFLTFANFETILRQISVTMWIAVGMTMVIIAKEIDLSVGAMVGLSGIVFSWLIVYGGFHPALAALATVALAAAVGAFTGILRVRWGIASFITTLGLLSMLRGAALYIGDGVSIGPLPDGLQWFWYGEVLGIKMPIFLSMLIVGLGWFVLSKTVFGRHIYAIGGNATTASRYGVRVGFLRIMVFVIVQVMAALGGMLLAIRLNAADAGNGELLELDVIAAVIVGGTSFSGGVGRIVGTVLGVLFIAVLRNGMILLGVNPILFMFMQGLVIILAVWWSMLRRGQNKDGGLE